MNKFTHLHLHTHYSLLDGLTNPGKLIARVKELGMDSVAITDHGNMYGAIEFYKEAKKQGIKPIVGCEVYVAENGHTDRNPNDDIYHLILLAKNTKGYKNLIKLISIANLKGFYRRPRIDRELLEKYSEGLVCLSGCLSGQVSRNFLNGNNEKALESIEWHKRVFGDDYYIEIQRHKNNKEQWQVEPLLIEAAKKYNIPMVATCDCHYLMKEDAHTHDVLLAVQTGANVDQKDRLSLIEDDFSVQDPKELAELFSDMPEVLANTQLVADKCNLDIKFGEIQLPRFETPKELELIDAHGSRTIKFDKQMDYDSYLSLLCNNGLYRRYGISEGGERPAEIQNRLDFELEVIKKTGFASYLLIVADIIQWARDNGIPVGPGRGSAAGSLICYLTGITNIDPLRYGLLFERFMNPDRISMPDIDMDFDEERRDEVLKYVEDKYGQDNVAQIITFGTMASRGAIRDAGRALNIPLPLCDKVAKLMPPNMDIPEAVKLIAELKEMYLSDEQARKLIDTAIGLEGVVRNAGTHACGVVIADKPINEYMPTQYSTRKDDSIVTQYDMNAIADLGLLKMDFLGLKNLTIIRKTLKNISDRYGFNLDMDNIPLNDQRAFKVLQEARTNSVFQLESDGMKRYLRLLVPTSIDDIAVMVSLYRPGPMELIPEYIDRKFKRKKVTYLHPLLEPILKDTYGIMIYQEQLMAAARALAGLTLAEADILRKAVGKKDAKLLAAQEKKFKDGAKRNGIDISTYEKFWELIEPFSRYGFNKSHAVSYAMIAYQTAFLKAHYPLEFTAAVMDCDSDNVERISFLINEAQVSGIEVLPPNINTSNVGFTVDGGRIRFGLSAIKGIGVNEVTRIVNEREDKAYDSVSDFVVRTGPTKKVLDILVRAGVFGEGTNKNTILQNIDQIISYGRIEEEDLAPEIHVMKHEEVSTIQRLTWEKELLGLFVSDSPLTKYRDDMRRQKTIPINELTTTEREFVSIGGLVNSTKLINTKKGQRMMFAQLQDESGIVELVVFPGAYEKFKNIILKDSIVVVMGNVQLEGDGCKLLVTVAKPIAQL